MKLNWVYDPYLMEGNGVHFANYEDDRFPLYRQPGFRIYKSYQQPGFVLYSVGGNLYHYSDKHVSVEAAKMKATELLKKSI